MCNVNEMHKYEMAGRFDYSNNILLTILFYCWKLLCYATRQIFAATIYTEVVYNF